MPSSDSFRTISARISGPNIRERVLMEVRRGIPVSPGIGIGRAIIIGHEDLRIRRRYVPAEEV